MTADPHNERDETWFGSGLRAHLGIKPNDEPAADEAADEPEQAPAAKVTVPEAPAFDERLAERARRLREAEHELAERERQVAEQAAQVERDREKLELLAGELEARAAELDTRAAEVAAAERQLPVRNTLRERAEGETDRLWRTIDEALEATFEDGRPDFHARLAAIKLLLGEAYDDASAAEALPPREGGHPADELAVRRAERFQL
jgi:DNA anti-recombination protein RmuC